MLCSYLLFEASALPSYATVAQPKARPKTPPVFVYATVALFKEEGGVLKKVSLEFFFDEVCYELDHFVEVVFI